jgi:hypothetical protein
MALQVHFDESARAVDGGQDAACILALKLGLGDVVANAQVLHGLAVVAQDGRDHRIHIVGRAVLGAGVAQLRHLVDVEGAVGLEDDHEAPPTLPMPRMKSRRTEVPKFGGGSMVGGDVDDGADGVDQQAELDALAVAHGVEDDDAALLADPRPARGRSGPAGRSPAPPSRAG